MFVSNQTFSQCIELGGNNDLSPYIPGNCPNPTLSISSVGTTGLTQGPLTWTTVNSSASGVFTFTAQSGGNQCGNAITIIVLDTENTYVDNGCYNLDFVIPSANPPGTMYAFAINPLPHPPNR